MANTLGSDGLDDVNVRVTSEDDSRLYGERYRGRGCLGQGGFGRVVLAYDKQLNRDVAIKVLHLRQNRAARERFKREMTFMMELRHPSVVPIFDAGYLKDRRPWYAMPVVEQRAPDDAGPGSNITRLRKRVTILVQVAQAIAYAHSKNIVHRDLSPQNVMYGRLGEVYVMDWGLATRIPPKKGDTTKPLKMSPPAQSSGQPHTSDGTVFGKRCYRSPEQACGHVAQIGPRTDVYALGAMLYEMLWGHPPHDFDSIDGRKRLCWRGFEGGVSPIFRALCNICKKALSINPHARYCDGGSFAKSLQAWLDNDKRRQRAETLLASGEGLMAQATRLRAAAEKLSEKAMAELRTLKISDSADKKKGPWGLLDKSASIRTDAEVVAAKGQLKVRDAQLIDPTFVKPQQHIKQSLRTQALAAERRGDRGAAMFHCEILRGLDKGDPFLADDGKITLATNPPGALVTYRRYELKQRRLQLGKKRKLGLTPIVERTIPMGSYLLKIKAAGRPVVRYPVFIGRGEHWDGIRPGSREPFPIPLPEQGELGKNDRYVSAGWALFGGDEAALDSLPESRVWLDGFVIRRWPVTLGNFEELALNIVRDNAKAAAALLASAATSNTDLKERSNDWPVANITIDQARLYADLLASRDVLPWRLPHEFEREKAARGVDGRYFPWGNHPEPCFCHVAKSHQGTPERAEVGGKRFDISPYDVADLAGNIRDICSNEWAPQGPKVTNSTINVFASNGTDEHYQSARGGAWNSPIFYARSSARYVLQPGTARPTAGMRLVRSYPGHM